MFKLTKHHMEALDAAARKEADRNLAAYARLRFPDRLGKAQNLELETLIRQSRTAAATHGFEQESDIAAILDLIVMYGPGFDQSGWPRDILVQREVPAPRRANQIRERLLAAPTSPPDAPLPPPAAQPHPAPMPPALVAGAAPVPADAPPVSPYPPAPPPSKGKLPTIEEAIQIRDAAVEQVAQLPPAQRNRVAAVSAAINTANGQVALGFKIHGENHGKSAEEIALAAVGGIAPTVKLTAPVEPRTRTALPVSRRTRKAIPAEQFVDGTIFEE